jgi:hypothetical protein
MFPSLVKYDWCYRLSGELASDFSLSFKLIGEFGIIVVVLKLYLLVFTVCLKFPETKYLLWLSNLEDLAVLNNYLLSFW